jgi:hypothetical protein
MGTINAVKNMPESYLAKHSELAVAFVAGDVNGWIHVLPSTDTLSLNAIAVDVSQQLPQEQIHALGNTLGAVLGANWAYLPFGEGSIVLQPDVTRRIALDHLQNAVVKALDSATDIAATVGQVAIEGEANSAEGKTFAIGKPYYHTKPPSPGQAPPLTELQKEKMRQPLREVIEIRTAGPAAFFTGGYSDEDYEMDARDLEEVNEAETVPEIYEELTGTCGQVLDDDVDLFHYSETLDPLGGFIFTDFGEEDGKRFRYYLVETYGISERYLCPKDGWKSVPAWSNFTEVVDEDELFDATLTFLGARTLPESVRYLRDKKDKTPLEMKVMTRLLQFMGQSGKDEVWHPTDVHK